MKSVKAGLVLLALAAQWALAGGPPSLTALQAARVERASPARQPDAGSAPRSGDDRLGTQGASTHLVALQGQITR